MQMVTYHLSHYVINLFLIILMYILIACILYKSSADNSVSLGWNLSFCISNKLSDDTKVLIYKSHIGYQGFMC